MLSNLDYSRLTALGIDRVSFRLPRLSRNDSGSPILILLGHSAAGKSAALEQLGIDRATSDMDVYCKSAGVRPSVNAMQEMVTALTYPIIVCANDQELLDELIASRDDSRISSFTFLYLRRPPSVISDNLLNVNTDGRRHPLIHDYSALYASFEKRYQALCDLQIDYGGSSLADVSALVRFALKRFAHTWLPQAGELWTPAVTRVSSPDREEMFYQEYLSLHAVAGQQKAAVQPLTSAEMRSLTAGGYQSFDASVFPPQATSDSIAFKKWHDLKWQREEFDGKSVVEIGCQLGFFTLQAAALGASQCVGVDINTRFVHEANKISVNYKTAVCGWKDDKVRFVTAEVVPGQSLPIKPDIIVANSIVHWWIIQNREMSIYDILRWLADNCVHGVYFEGCVSADEQIMKQHGVPAHRFNEELFLQACEKTFTTVTVIGRCSYNPQRIVVRLREKRFA